MFCGEDKQKKAIFIVDNSNFLIFCGEGRLWQKLDGLQLLYLDEQ